MKRLFLASNVGNVAKDIASELLPNNKKILFIKTASEVYGDNPKWLEHDRQKLKSAGFETSNYTITDKNKNDIKQAIKKNDIIFVSGGNSYYLLNKIQISNTADVFKEAVESGIPYIGSSAGSLIAGPSIEPVGKLDDITKAQDLNGFEALGIVDFVVYPHWGFDKYRAESIENMKQNYTKDFKFILLSDFQYVKVIDDMYQIVDVRNS